MIQPYLPFFHRLTESYLIQSKLKEIRESKRAIGGRVGFRIQEGREFVDRYVFLIEGKLHGADFKEGVFQGLKELDSGYHDKKLTEASVSGLFGKAKSKVIPKTADISKDILKGSEVFADAERKIRMFLRASKGRNIFVLAGQAGTGKTQSARNALDKECGPEISPSKAYKTLQKRSFDKADFEIRLKAFESIEKAKNLYQRFLHNLTLSQNKQKGQTLFPVDVKQQALDLVQQKLEHDLYGYQLTLEDMEGSGDIHKSASDVIDKLKKLGGEDASVPYSPKHGWMEMSQKVNNEELFLHFYESNGGVLFVDEGDYFLESSNPLMKTAYNNQPYRKVSIGNKGYAEVQNRIIPDEIIYSGKLVITTNLPVKQWDSAIKSRSDIYLFYLTLNQLFDRLKDIIPAIHKKDLNHLPQLLLVGMMGTLKNFAKAGELTTFDYRNFISLCDEFALILEDEILKEKENNPNITFSIYGTKKGPVSDEELKSWRESPEGKSIWHKAQAKFKKTLLNQIQQMNRAKPMEDPENVIEFKKDGTDD